MDHFLFYSWLPVSAAAALILCIKLAAFAGAVWGLLHSRRYFRHLAPVSSDGRYDVSAYIECARSVALGLGLEYVNTYRSYRHGGRQTHLDLWRARDSDVLVIVSSRRSWLVHHPRTAFISVLDDGSRVTTSDNGDDGDPRGLTGEVVRPGSSFRELHDLHRRRVRESGRPAERIGWADPLGVIEDLTRSHVQQLADAGLARYRGESQSAWSYSLRGVCEIMYRARPRRTSARERMRAAAIEKTAE
jgi:hypothetical protein